MILTHSHYDHISILSQICELFSPSVYAFSDFFYKDVVKLGDRQKIAIGDRCFEVLHTPSHSNDSICLFCESDGVLFVGDVQFDLKDPGIDMEANISMFLITFLKRSQLHLSRSWETDHYKMQ